MKFEVEGPDGQKVIVEGPDPHGAARAAAEYFRQQAAQPERPGLVGGTSAAMTDGLTVGFGDEYLAGLSAVAGLQPDGQGGADWFQYEKPLAERYDVALEAIRAEQEQFREDHPVAAYGGEIVGGLAGPGKVVKPAATLMGNVGRAMVTGGFGGSLYAFGEGEGSLNERAEEIPAGLVTGAVAGGVLTVGARAINAARNRYGDRVAAMIQNSGLFSDGQFTNRGRSLLGKLGLDADEVRRTLIADVSAKTKAATAATNRADFDEFGIPVYRKDVTGSVDDQAFYQGAKAGKFGDGPQRKIQAADDAQMSAFRHAGDNLGEDLSPGQGRVTAADAGEAVMMRARSMNQSQKAAAEAAYDTAERFGLSLDEAAIKGVGPRLRSVMADQDISVDGTTAGRLLNEMDKWSKGSGGVSLKRVEAMRKRINAAMRGSQGDDNYTLGKLKEAYDGWLEGSIEAELFSGDIAGLAAQKEAREVFRNYAMNFRGKDKASKFLQAMVDADGDPGQVVRWLFGASRLGSGRMTAGVATSLRDTIGRDSAEWGMIRQAAWRRLITSAEGSDQPGTQKISQNIFRFINGDDTKNLAHTLFSKEERALMLRYAAVAKRMTPQKSATNPSGSGYENARTLRLVSDGIAGSLGMATAGPMGAAAGVQGSQAVRGVGGFLKTQAALKGITPSMATGGARGGAVSGSVAGGATTGSGQDPQR